MKIENKFDNNFYNVEVVGSNFKVTDNEGSYCRFATLSEMIREYNGILAILDEYFIFEYGQKELFDNILEYVDNYVYNGTSSNRIGYYWYTITIDGVNFEVWCK
jgi:hypothetical protein